MTPSAPDPTEPRVHGEAIVYRLFDVGYGIALERASDLLASSGPERRRPSRGEAQTIQIPNPPVTVGLGSETIEIDGRPVEADLSARVFDFGVVSLRARIEPPAPLGWTGFIAWGTACVNAPGWREIFLEARRTLLDRIAPAVTKLGDSPLTEDYVVFRIDRMVDASQGRLPAAALRDEEITQLLTGESRSLSAAARRDLLSQRFSYFEDDLAILTWNAALVVEPVAEDTDVQYVLEFANAQLLELRWYDAVLDAEVPAIQTRFRQARQGFHLFGRSYSRLLESLQQRVADSVEMIERVENSLKVTDDVFLARVYAGALEEFRERTWRSGIERKIAIVRGTYDMLNSESLVRRSETLEIIIVLLIAFEIGLALLRR
jgi:hypothetical protein